MKKRIAIIGGIGSGKSVVSQILRVMGFPVYDCDAEAKRLMDNSQKIKSRIVDAFGEESLLNGQLNRPYLATMVFGHPENLKKLNGIVHPEVHADFEQWVSECNADAVFVETAILFESGMDALIDEIWLVDAPEDIRVARVVKRNGLPVEQVQARIRSQKIIAETRLPLFRIDNSGKVSLLPQIDELIAKDNLTIERIVQK